VAASARPSTRSKAPAKAASKEAASARRTQASRRASKDSARTGRASQPIRKAGSRAERKHPVARRRLRTFFIVLLLLALLVVGLFSWNRWLRYDDAADIQGEWKDAANKTTLVIDGSRMKITSDVAYPYTIDTFQKTITYTFGTSKGWASYRFSDDRKTLVIEESTPTNWLVALHIETDPVIDGGTVSQGVTKLVKIGSDTSADPQSLVNNSTYSADTLGKAIVDGSASSSGAASSASNAG
jgi:hypothetical protein